MLYSKALQRPYQRPYVPMDKKDVEIIQRAGSTYRALLARSEQAWKEKNQIEAIRCSRRADKLRVEILARYDILL